MAFAKDDYWKGRTGATNAQVRQPPPSPGPDIPGLIAKSRSGHPPTAADVFAAIEAIDNQQRQPNGKLPDNSQQQLDYLLYGASRDASKPSLYNNPADAFSKMLSAGAGIGVHPEPTHQQANLLKDTATNILSAVGGLFGGDGGGAQSESPEALLRRLQEAAGQYTYSGPSAAQMAKAEFDPQFALLKQLADQTSKRYAGQKSEITGLFQGLENRNKQSRAEDQAAYAAALKGSQGDYAAGAKNLSQGVTDNSTKMAQELARLGVLEGTADVNSQVQQNLQDNLGALSSQGQNSQDLLRTLGANQYAYDTSGINLGRQQGVETQRDFMQMFNDAMAQNDQQRLALTGQQSQAQNNYQMQIQKLLQEGQQGLSSNVTDQFKALLAAQDSQASNYYRQAGLDLDQQKFAYQQQQDAFKQSNSGQPLNAYDALQQRALSTYNDPTRARQAVDEILAAYQNNPNVKTVGDFLNSVDQETLRQNPELTSLIYDFISRIVGQNQGR